MSFANVRANLELNISNFASNMRKASDMMAKFAASSVNGSSTANKAFVDYGKEIKNATRTLRTHNLGLKDTARIIQGILVSQVFYRIAGDIRDAIRSLWSFNEALDYAGVTYTALMGSQELSDNFLAVLREQAEQTIFSFEDLADTSKKLLAYGIPYENLLFISEGLTNLGAMSGDTQALDRIALALGQIYAKGKLSAEEMRQLANAYVPIQDIVRSKFNLTDDQMGKIGDLKLPAADVINAIVDYANEKFGSVGDAAMLTITGLKNKITDSLKNLGVDVLRPLTRFYKSLLTFLAEKTQEIGSVYDKGGIKGVFEHLVPDPSTQKTIRQTLANLSNLFHVFGSFLKVLMSIGREFAGSLAAAFNVLAPVINSTISVIVGALQVLTSNTRVLRILTAALATAAAAWVAFKVKALGAMIVGALAKVIYGVAKAVAFLSATLAKSPIVTALLLISLGIAGVAAMSKRADNAITSLFDKLSGLNGKASDDVLQDTTGNLGDASAAADTFNNRLGDVEGSIDDVGDAAASAGSKAKKAAAGLLSFDEVFKLTEKASSGSGSGSNAYNLDDMLGGLDGLGAGIGDALMPEIPDLSEFGNDFVNNLKDSILSKIAATGMGLWFAQKLGKELEKAKLGPTATKIAGSLIKGLGGAFMGLGLDAIVSPLTDKLWKLIADKLDLSEDSAMKASIGSTIGAGIGGAIGFMVGGPLGALIGTSIGELAGGVVGLFKDAIGAAFNNTAIFGGLGIAQAIAKAFGGAIKDLPGLLTFDSFGGFFRSLADLFKGAGLKAVAKGGIIGMAIGFISDALAGVLWDTLAKKLELSSKDVGNAKVGQTIGSIIGLIIGGIFGGPVGATIGSVIGTFAGGFAGLFWEKIETALVSTFGREHNPITDFICTSAEGLAKWWSETSKGFTSWASGTFTSLSTWWKDTKSGFSTWWSDTTSKLSNWWSDTVSIFSDWDSITGDTLSDWWERTSTGFSDWKGSTFEKFNTWKDSTIDGIKTWVSDTFSSFAGWYSDTVSKFTTWRLSVVGIFMGWVADIKDKINNWISDTFNSISTWVSDTASSISSWVTDTASDIGAWAEDVLTVFGGFAISAVKAVGQWLSNTGESMSTWFTQKKSDVKTWWENLWNPTSWSTGFTRLSSWFDKFKTDISNWISKLDIKGWWSKLWSPSSWASGWSHVKSWFTQLGKDLANWFSGLWDRVSTWWTNLWKGRSASTTKNGDNTSVSSSNGSKPYFGYAKGGIIDREQIARIGEGNKREAIIPLENASAMQPFVDAVAAGIVQGIAPTLAVAGGSGAAPLPPMYVGTLIADDRGLAELYKKFELIEAKESIRRVRK